MKRALVAAVSLFVMSITAASASTDDDLKRSAKLIFDGNQLGAIKILNGVIKKEPRNAIAFARRGHAYHDLENNTKAIQDLQTALNLQPHCAEALYSMGQCYATAKKLPLAINYYTKAIAEDPANIDHYSARGMLLQLTNRNKESVADFSKCLELNPKARWAHVQRAISNEQDHQYDAALEDLNLLVKDDPNIFDCFEMRGKCLLAKGDATAAAADFEKVIKMEPKYAGGYVYHARALQKLQGADSKQAAADLLIAQKYGYEPPEAKRSGVASSPKSAVKQSQHK